MPIPTVSVFDGAEWVQLDNAVEADIVRRFGRGSYATVRIEPATIAQRLLCRMHRRLRIIFLEDSQFVRFMGVIAAPRVEVTEPGEFALMLECVSLEEEARTRFPATTLTYPDKIESISEDFIDATDDAFIDPNDEDTNFGSETFMQVGTARIGLIRFDLAGTIGENDRVGRARLHLHTLAAQGLANLRIELVTEDWAEGTVTYNNRPDVEDFTDQPDGFKVFGVQSQVAEQSHLLASGLVNVAGIVRRQRGVEATGDNYGMQITSLGPAPGLRLFASKDNAEVSLHPQLYVQYHPPVLITEVLKDVWNELWPDVDTSDVEESTGFYVPIDTVYTREDNLFQITEDLRSRIPHYEWWVEWAGDDEGSPILKLRFETAGASGPTLTADDLRFASEIEPTNAVIRNVIRVVGEVGGGVDDDGVALPSLPSFGEARDLASIAVFGELKAVVNASLPAETSDDLYQEARALVAGSAWEFWRARIVTDDMTIGPGTQVTLDLDDLGLDGADFGEDFLCEEVRDHITRGGFLTREATLIENRGS